MTIYLRPEIEKLSEALELKLAEGWLDPLQRYLPAMKKYLEYQISLDKGALSVITLGGEPAFLDQIEAHLREIGLTAEALAVFGAMRSRVERATWGLKLALTSKNDIQVYIKKPLPLEQVLRELESQGLKAAAADKIKRIAAHLEKSHTHFLGADFTPGQSVPYQLYFTQYTDQEGTVSRRLQRVISELDLPASVVDQFSQTYTLLAYPQQTIWISLGVVEGTLLPSLKLDYSSIPFTTVAQCLETLYFPEKAYGHLRGIAETLGVQTASYMSLRLGASAPSSSIYLTRIKRA